LILILWVWVSAFAIEDGVFTSHEVISNSAFPQHAMSAKYVRATSAEEKRINEVRETVAEHIRSFSSEWSVPILGRAIQTGERERLLDAFIRSPLFFCRNEPCPGCRGASGCMLHKEVTGVLASAQLLSPQYRSSRAREALLEVLYGSLVDLLYAQTDGGMSQSKERRDLIKQAVSSLTQDASIRMQMKARCPGPFLDSERQYLERNNALQPLNEFWEQCGSELLGPVRKLESVPECARLIDLKRWAKTRKEGWFSGPVVFRRCEESCESATCGKPKAPLARLIPFQSSAVVSLPPQSCEGATALEPSRLARQVILSYLKPEVRRASSQAKEVKLCLAKLVGRADRVNETAQPTPVEAPIELNLVE
jgi:hypothetical protein